MKLAVRSKINEVLARFNLELRRRSTGRDLANYLEGLRREHSIEIDVIYDVGANTGEWSRQLAKRLSYCPTFVLFEGNPDHLPSLKDTGFQHHIALLGDTNRLVDYYQNGGTGDSIFRENGANYEAVVPSQVRLRRLDDLVSEHDIPAAGMIKLDTQGSELLVLTGAAAAVHAADLIYLEMPVLTYNQGAPSWSEYMTFLTVRKFIPIAVLEEHILAGSLVQLDLLFMSARMFEVIHGRRALEFVLPLLSTSK